MEPWFPRKPRAVAVEQAALLARTAADQAASATARAQHRIEAERMADGHKSHVAMFDGERNETGAGEASFATLDRPVFRPGQSN